MVKLRKRGAGGWSVCDGGSVCLTFGGDESRLALLARPGLVHRLDVKQVVLVGLKVDLLLAASDA